MDDNELLSKIKIELGIITDDPEMDDRIKSKMLAVKHFLITGGAPETVGTNNSEVTCIAIGVNDLLDSTSGNIKFSPAFKMMANQICR